MKKTRIKFLFKLLLSSILSFSILTSFTSAKSQVTHVLNSFSENHDIISIVAHKIGIKKITESQRNSINEYMQIVAYFETKLQNDTQDGYYRGYRNTAKGYFQFLNKSFNWVKGIIVNKIDNTFPKANNIYEYSYQGQAQFSIVLWNQFASKKEMRDLFNRNYSSGKKVYCKYHHTNCSGQLTKSRYRELESALKNWSKNNYFIGPKENRDSMKSIKTEKITLEKKILGSVTDSNKIKQIKLEKIRLLKKSIEIITARIQELKLINKFNKQINSNL